MKSRDHLELLLGKPQIKCQALHLHWNIKHKSTNSVVLMEDWKIWQSFTTGKYTFPWTISVFIQYQQYKYHTKEMSCDNSIHSALIFQNGRIYKRYVRKVWFWALIVSHPVGRREQKTAHFYTSFRCLQSQYQELFTRVIPVELSQKYSSSMKSRSHSSLRTRGLSWRSQSCHLGWNRKHNRLLAGSRDADSFSRTDCGFEDTTSERDQ